MSLLVFDVETNGLPKNMHLPAKYTKNWPRIVQISWIIYDLQGSELERQDYIIKPDGFVINEKSIEIHKVTNEIAHKVGYKMIDILHKMNESIKNANYIVCHNFDFDFKVLGAEFIRHNMKLGARHIKDYICTMKSTTNYCKLENSYRKDYKWPRLEELYKILFNEEMENAHNALYDVIACGRCLFECIKRGIIKMKK